MSDAAKQRSEAMLEKAKEWLAHAHGENGCPFDYADEDTGAEKCLAVLLESVRDEALEEAALCAERQRLGTGPLGVAFAIRALRTKQQGGK